MATHSLRAIDHRYMRQIKFRAWNKNWGMMLPVAKLTFECDVQSLMVYNEATDGLHEEWEDEVIGEDVFLMQFTGLTDKNGKEIYEGDVVKWDDTEQCGYIEYAPEATEYVVDEWKTGNTRSEGHSLSSLGAVEIIGNIYENADLLK